MVCLGWLQIMLRSYAIEYAITRLINSCLFYIYIYIHTYIISSFVIYFCRFAELIKEEESGGAELGDIAGFAPESCFIYRGDKAVGSRYPRGERE